jgi:hypothetical protein
MWTLSGFADEIDPDLTTQCAVMNDIGITHVEFRSAWDTNVLDLSDEQLEDAAKILTAHDLSVSSIGSPLGKINIEDDFDAHLVRADRALAVAQRLGAPFIRIFSFFLRPDQAPERYRDEVLRRMAALAARTEPTGLVLLHENEKDIYGDIPARVRDYVALPRANRYQGLHTQVLDRQGQRMFIEIRSLAMDAIAERGPLAVREVKRLIDRSVEMDIDAGIAAEDDFVALVDVEGGPLAAVEHLEDGLPQRFRFAHFSVLAQPA